MQATLARTNIAQLLHAADTRRAASPSPSRSYDHLTRADPVYPGFFTREYMNFGLWHPGVTTRREASDSLMAALIEPMVDRSGTILDVACGLGFTTRYLTRHWAAERVTALNLSTEQLAAARMNAPGCSYSCMDAAAMTYPDASFDNMVCVEAAFHFRTRQSFLRHAWRVLRPGGVLALTDVLLHENGHRLLPSWLDVNYLPSIEAYRHVMTEDAGFSDVVVTDITAAGARSYLRHMFVKVHDDWMAGGCDYAGLQRALDVLHRTAAGIRCNLLCVGRKEA